MDSTIKYINDELGTAEILTQLAKEATEVAQAALKLRRAINGSNPTPVNIGAAWQDLKEELADVQVCRTVIFENSASDEDINEIAERKLARWEQRLKDRHAEPESEGE